MGTKNITEITRREIASLFCNGYIDSSMSWIDTDLGKGTTILYPYYGRLEEIEFLNKIYPLEKMGSTDFRFSNAEGDIWQHTVNNDDWEYGWVFADSRFGLIDGDDSILLNFLCTVFNPSYRDESGYWREYLVKIQELLRVDGYELYISQYISGRELYKWRELTNAEKVSSVFVPFSIRYNGLKIQMPKINISKRKALINLMLQQEDTEYITTETGWNYSRLTRDAVIDDLKKHYTPKAYNEKGIYCDEDNFENLILNTSPKSIFDIIEIYSTYKDFNFENKINALLRDICFQLKDCKIMHTEPQIQAEIPRDSDLRDLIQQAEIRRKQVDSTSMQLALEKIWDAFEQLKTYYSSDKKISLQTIISRISPTNTDLYNRINDEFAELTKIGNTYKIRHFEKGKLDIPDDRIKEYFYMRCLAIINLVVKYVEQDKI